MSSPFLIVCRHGARWCAHAVLSLLVWTLWLALALLLAGQLYIARTDELQVPAFVQRALEQRLALSGVHVAFGRTRFDPSGRILAEDVRLTLPGFEEALVNARAVYARLDLWALLIGRFEPVELRVTGVNLRVPALLSPSGKADEIVRDLDADFLLHREELDVVNLTYHLGTMAVSMRGALHLATSAARGAEPLPVADFLAQNYANLSREGAAVIGSLTMFDRPVLFARFVPSVQNGAWVEGTLMAERFHRETPQPIEAANLVVRGRLPLWSAREEPFAAFLSADQVSLPKSGAVAHNLAAWVGARLKIDRFGPSLTGRIVGRASAADLSAADLTIVDPIIRFEVGRADPSASSDAAGWRRSSALGSARSTGSDKAGLDVSTLHANLLGLLWSERIAVDGELDLKRGDGLVNFEGSVAPDAVGYVGRRAKKDLGRWITLTSPLALKATADFGPGWKLVRAGGSGAAGDLTANHVHIDEVRGRFEFDGRHLIAPEAYARLGEDFARGSYEEDFLTRDYRFLLQGRMRPLDISPWIAGKWWREFFSNMEFPAEPPLADMDLSGCWRNGRKAAVFVAVDCAHPVFRGIDFDRVHTRLFVRPQFDDDFNLQAYRGASVVRGSFTRRINLDTGAWQSLDLDLSSSLGFDAARKVMGPSAPSVLALFDSERPPQVSLQGHLDGPSAPTGPHQSLHIEANAAGRFSYEDFPLERAAFVADVHDANITLDRVQAAFAGGNVSGRARIRGHADSRRLQFEASLRGASLGRAVGTVDAFTAARAHKPAPAPGEFVKDKANVLLDADLSAEGTFGDYLSYHGAGSASLRGAELGEVRMLGLLSAVFTVTSLRFTSAHALFALDGPRLLFSNVTVTGANSAIEAKGSYGLEGHILDFRATVNPFKESKSLPQKFMDMLLTPLSTVFAVRLIGTVEKPSWEFVNGPSGLLRSLSSPGSSPPPSPLKD